MKSLPFVQRKKVTTTSSKKSTSKFSTLHRIKSAKIPSPYLKKMKRYTKQGVKSLLLSPLFYSMCKVIGTASVVIIVLYSSYLFIGKTFANEVVVSQSEIVARVAKLTNVPQEDPSEIVRVQDQEDLRKQNPFYKDVQEGDYILMYKNTAIIYSLKNNAIVAVKRIETNTRP